MVWPQSPCCSHNTEPTWIQTPGLQHARFVSSEAYIYSQFPNLSSEITEPASYLQHLSAINAAHTAEHLKALVRANFPPVPASHLTLESKHTIKKAKVLLLPTLGGEGGRRVSRGGRAPLSPLFAAPPAKPTHCQDELVSLLTQFI